jgi:ferredoxin
LRIVTDQLIREYDIKIYLHSLAVSVSQDSNRLKSVIYESKGGRFAIEAESFIDATGDGDIAASAGAKYEINPGKTQFPTTIFCIGNVDTETANSFKREEIAELMEKSRADGEFDLPRTDARMVVAPVTGEIRCNFTRVGKDGRPVNGLDVGELSHGEIEGRLQTLEYLRFLRQKVPGFENASISQLPVMLGVRETRRIVGEYQLTKKDVLSSRKFDDAIGCNRGPSSFINPVLIPNGSKLCDRCGNCTEHCPTLALDIQDTKSIEIEDRAYTRANKNLWRCAWAEHFMLDLNLPIPEHIDERVLLRNVEKHGLRTNAFGNCRCIYCRNHGAWLASPLSGTAIRAAFPNGVLNI